MLDEISLLRNQSSYRNYTINEWEKSSPPWFPQSRDVPVVSSANQVEAWILKLTIDLALC